MRREGTSTATPRIARVVFVLAVALASACRTDPAEATAEGGTERERFIATYVDLRAASIAATEADLTPAERSEILARHEVSEQDLLDFVELHGGDVVFMRNLWDEVERRLDGVRVERDDRR